MSQNKPKLLLIQPTFFDIKIGRHTAILPPLRLAYVAAYTPEHWDIEILDEQIEVLPEPYPHADLVGLTTTTGNINRAYEIAKYYREQGIKVILGGIHSSMVPEESSQYCDCLVIGDAETVWEQVISDFEQGQLKPRYDANEPALVNLRLPRRDLLSDQYLMGSISTSRGCPLRCTFCAIHNFYKRSYRLRPVEEIIEELKVIKEKMLFFSDGNLYGYNKAARDHFVQLVKRMTEERQKGSFQFDYWFGYVTVNMLEDEEALKFAAAAGCKTLLIGFESINPETLKEMKKASNIKRVHQYKDLIKNAIRHRIMVLAEIVLGFDNDDETTIKLTQDFLNNSGLDLFRIQMLQPLPGTETFTQLQQQKRLYINDFPKDWDILRKDFTYGIHFELKNLDPYWLKREIMSAGRHFYQLHKIIYRSLRSLLRYRNWGFSIYFFNRSLELWRNYKKQDVSTEVLAQQIEPGRQKRQLTLDN